jgi:hypothetical protein
MELLVGVPNCDEDTAMTRCGVAGLKRCHEYVMASDGLQDWLFKQDYPIGSVNAASLHMQSDLDGVQ